MIGKEEKLPALYFASGCFHYYRKHAPLAKEA